MNVKFDPLFGCPLCNGINTTSDIHLEYDDVVHWDMTCHDCNYDWIDIFTYSRSIDRKSDETLVVVSNT